MFHGVIVPIVTFFDKNQEIDFPAQKAHSEFLIENGVDAIFIMGSAGEGVCLCDEAKVMLTEKTAEFIRKRVKLLAGISQESTTRCKRLMDKLKDYPVDAFVVTLPYYFPISSQESIRDFFTEIADYSPKPIFVYNIPCFTKALIAPETTAKLSLHPNIIGVKDSYPDLSHALKLIREVKKANPEFRIFIGEESIVASLAKENFDGIVPIYGNIFPGITVRLFRGVKEKDYDMVTKMQSELNEAKLILPCADTFYAALKGYLSLRGTGTSVVLSPVRTATNEQMHMIKKFFDMLENKKINIVQECLKNINCHLDPADGFSHAVSDFRQQSNKVELAKQSGISIL
jgi:dihydrodipicolinate synthase/N-acetylneuraminate lyase